MIEALKVRSKLIREQFQVYGFFNILLATAIILFVFGGLKYLFHLFPDSFVLKEFLSSGLVLLGAINIQNKTISQGEIKMHSFFPFLSNQSVKRLFLFQKPIVIYLLAIYLLFPTQFNNEEFKGFFFFFGIFMVLICINTLSTNFFPTKWGNNVNVFLRLGYWGFLMIYSQDTINFDLKIFVNNIGIIYLAIIAISFSIINLFIISRPNRKGNNDD